MPFINVEVDESVQRRAKAAAARAGLSMKLWLPRAIERQAAAEEKDAPEDQIRLREPLG